MVSVHEPTMGTVMAVASLAMIVFNVWLAAESIRDYKAYRDKGFMVHATVMFFNAGLWSYIFVSAILRFLGLA